MSSGLSREEVTFWLGKIRQSELNEECMNCGILQGFLIQLEMDAEEDAQDLIEPLKVKREEMHARLGCEPCVGAMIFAEYLKRD